MHLAQIGKPTLGESTKQVQRRHRLVVGLKQARGVRRPIGSGEHLGVNDVAPERVEHQAVALLGSARSRLCELPCDPADLDHRDARGVGQGDSHLQNDFELVPDLVGGGVVEGLRTVAGLEKEGPTGGNVGEVVRQATRLAGEDERWQEG